MEGQGQEEVAMDVGEHIPFNYGTTASSQRATSTESQVSSERADLMLFRLVRYESMYVKREEPTEYTATNDNK